MIDEIGIDNLRSLVRTWINHGLLGKQIHELISKDIETFISLEKGE